MAKVKIEFTVTWKGAQEAKLVFLRDDEVVSLEGKETTGRGKIVVHYLANNTGVHKIRWGLEFPTRKIGGFAATASIGGGDPQALGGVDDEQEHKWTGDGTAVG